MQQAARTAGSRVRPRRAATAAAQHQRRSYMGRPVLVIKSDRFAYPRAGGPAVYPGKVSAALPVPAEVAAPPYAGFDWESGLAPRGHDTKSSRHDLGGVEVPRIRKASAAASLVDDAALPAHQHKTSSQPANQPTSQPASGQRLAASPAAASNTRPRSSSQPSLPAPARSPLT